MKRILLLSLLLLIFSTSCKLLKVNKLLHEGSVAETTFKREIPFEFRMGLVIIPVVIKGKTYDFMVDTGAPNLISTELAAKIGATPVVSKKAKDSQGASSELDFLLIDTVTVDGVNFLTTGAAIADLSQSNELACLHIDGFIGSNLMRQAVWQFDYSRQIITVVSSVEQLSLPENSASVPFKQVASGTPKIELEFNGHTESNVTFDTGCNSAFSSNSKLYEVLAKDTDSLETIYGVGRNSSGLYGSSGPDTTHYSVVSVKVGDLLVPDQIAYFKGSQSTLLGTDFLKNYRVVIDWSTEKIFLLPNEQKEPVVMKGFGFSMNRSGEQLLVSFIYHDADAEKAGMLFGDKVLSINGTDYSVLTDASWCDLLYDGAGGKSAQQITVQVLRGEEKLSFQLEKKVLLAPGTVR